MKFWDAMKELYEFVLIAWSTTVAFYMIGVHYREVICLYLLLYFLHPQPIRK